VNIWDADLADVELYLNSQPLNQHTVPIARSRGPVRGYCVATVTSGDRTSRHVEL
jgi:hypothetical protein